MTGHEFDGNSDIMDYFVITMFSELDAQPYLRKILYDHYTILAQSDWYIVFDLTQPK